MSSLQRRRHRARPRRRTVLAGSAAAAVVVSGALSATPWLSALLIRAAFEAGARALVTEMTPYVPRAGFVETLDVPVDRPGSRRSIDVFGPAAATGLRPTVIWIHGGAWISGSKADVAPYLRILAARGYTTIGLDYPTSPERTYPRAVAELNDTIGYILEHAEDLGVDPTRIVLAGDSAGAQLASQLAALVTNPEYAHLLGIAPTLSAQHLLGTVLHCGVYNLHAMADLNGITAWGFRIALWAYTGTRDWSDTSAGATMSTVDFVTGDFPPTFLSGGNGDRLTWLQSVPMATALSNQGVDVTRLFWPANHATALPHEYQFHLDLPEAQTALSDTLDFLDRVTR